MPATSMTPPASPATTSRLGLIVLGLLILATWTVSHSYLGIFHDAGLYTLQALAHVHPESLGHDVFLASGSQDRFTMFSPLYAAAIRLLGVEPAAALLTLLSQFAVLGGAWALARAVLPAPLAWLGVAVLVAIPGDYGAGRVFTCIEGFLTPRMAAEALALASLAAACSPRRTLAALLLVMSVLIHPVMAAAAIAALLFLYVAIPRPRLALALVIAALVAISAQSIVLPTGPWGRFDTTWWTLVTNRSPYLLMNAWRLDDWSRVALSLATLAIGCAALDQPRARRIALATAMTVMSGLALTAIACDGLHLVLFTQLQPWRWQWLGTVVAALLLPGILTTLGARDIAGRSAALLLTAAWIFGADSFAIAAAAAALVALAFAQRLKPDEARWVFWGACGLLAIACVWRLASNLEFTDAHYLDANIPLWLRRSISFCHDGTAPAALMALAWWLAQPPRPSPVQAPAQASAPSPGESPAKSPSPSAPRFTVLPRSAVSAAIAALALPVLVVLGVLALAVCALLMPPTWHGWTAREFPQTQAQRFATFRQMIPPGADVFWPESPLGVWLLLGRPSYLSVLQTSGMVFSRPTAIELNRRAHALEPALPAGAFLNWNIAGTAMNLSRQQLQQTCATGAFDYLATSADLGVAPAITIPALIHAGATPANALPGAALPTVAAPAIYLYRCRPSNG